ncbi:hypothetical protein N7495_004650 [Penicillium taxi]|uniref:uncharacterized protein n=1 Tax=Penicillium taxi TaxID=168475 RepID=UPI00254592CF|nr:uncharacterized protein N7495_004650 [Penicillium taxi]KAJ5899906.1 hypothetical protein N7495_004650 [Penicillium taxi]
MSEVECISMASRHHPHHPHNYHRASKSTSVIGSNNPYLKFMTPGLDHRSSITHAEYEPSLAASSVFWTDLEHQPVEPRPRRKRDSAPHRRSSHRTYNRNSLLVNPDIIDRLDDVSIYSYHHEGPYDAVCPERNHLSRFSPLEAVKESNAEALRATPRDKIIDSLNSHRPLDGTAFFPPGTTDPNGQTYDYEEGSNMMNEHGNFMRFPGLKFTDEDFKKDPFYNRPITNPFTQLRKKLSLRRNKKRSSTIF